MILSGRLIKKGVALEPTVRHRQVPLSETAKTTPNGMCPDTKHSVEKLGGFDGLCVGKLFYYRSYCGSAFSFQKRNVSQC